MLRYLTAGESHGKALVVILEGVPAGLDLTVEHIADELARRRLGYGRGPRMRFEADEVTLVAGVRHGRTLGSPIAIEIANSEWDRPPRKWAEEMSPHPGATKQPLTTPRPGHADLTGMQKYDFDDARNVLERASARETAARVAAGAVAKQLLAALGAEIGSHVIQLGPVRTDPARRPVAGALQAVDASEVRCADPDAEAAIIDEIKAAAKDGDSLGGVVRGPGLRRSRGSRQPRPLGPQARRPPRPGPHEHPGREGRRARRRLRRRRSAGERGPRSHRLGRRGRRVPPHERVRRRARGRDDHR